MGFVLKYGLKDLKEKFKELQALTDDHTVIPIMHVLALYFRENLYKNCELFDATDARGMGGDGIWVVMDGKMVSVGFNLRAIDVHDDDESGWLMYSEVYFDGGRKEQEEQVKKLYERFKEFAGEIGLENLKAVAKDCLKGNKEIIRRRDIAEFYFT